MTRRERDGEVSGSGNAKTHLIAVQLVFTNNLDGDLLASVLVAGFVHIRECTAGEGIGQQCQSHWSKPKELSQCV